MPRDIKHDRSLVYGPVPSRRLGRSLGVDLVPYKTCTYDCIYCQIGRTPQTTTERKPYIEPQKILAELESRLAEGIKPDYITLGGSGEPCLNSDIGLIIERIKQMTDTKVAVLTNGSLLWSEHVRNDLLQAHVVLPSLDACNANLFNKINRPHPDISFETMTRGLAEFRRVYSGSIWLEIFIVQGVNDTEAAITGFKPFLESICPDRVHINTAVRPPAEDFAGQVSMESLESLASALGRGTEVIAEFKNSGNAGRGKEVDRQILDMLSRRPCTTKDIAAGFGLREESVADKMSELSASGLVETRKSGERVYYIKKS
ncbi:MAG: radical SAM protein [Desulfobacteraceae bacterium]|nr:radical SAM protein [Desulfobacteraceae bacterium]